MTMMTKRKVIGNNTVSYKGHDYKLRPEDVTITLRGVFWKQYYITLTLTGTGNIINA